MWPQTTITFLYEKIYSAAPFEYIKSSLSYLLFRLWILKEIDPMEDTSYYSLREKCPYSEFSWSVFPRIRTEHGEIRSISPYSVRMREKYRPEKLRIETLFTQWLFSSFSFFRCFCLADIHSSESFSLCNDTCVLMVPLHPETPTFNYFHT